MNALFLLCNTEINNAHCLGETVVNPNLKAVIKMAKLHLKEAVNVVGMLETI